MKSEWSFSDEQILALLGECRASFMTGDRSALWHAVFLCAEQQAVMPEWVADEVIKIESDARNGTLTSFDHAFGYRRPHSGAVAATRKKKVHFDAVLHKLTLEIGRDKGVGPDLFDEIASGVDGASRRTVENIYKEAKAMGVRFSKNHSAVGDITGYLSGETRIRRRRGRSTF